MEFLKSKGSWSYQLPEWDNYEKQIIDTELEKVSDLLSVEYEMHPDVDVWTITYKDKQFIIANDLVHGCEISTDNEELLPYMEEVIKLLPL